MQLFARTIKLKLKKYCAHYSIIAKKKLRKMNRKKVHSHTFVNIEKHFVTNCQLNVFER